MKTIFLNSKEYKSSAESLFDFIESLNLESLNGKAFAVNNKVVSEKDFKSSKLKDGDKILLITASQGG